MTQHRFRLQVLLAVLVLVLALGTVGFALAEGLSPANALYLTVVTIGTVGYGDMYPVTAVGKVVAILVILGGAGVFVTLFANAAEYFLTRRQREFRMQKLHTMVGLFFSEVGTELLRLLSDRDPEAERLREHLRNVDDWNAAEFARVRRAVAAHPVKPQVRREDLPRLLAILRDRRELLLRILENPSLHERESFTELMRATFHLLEELSARREPASLPASDVEHLAGDAGRVYRLLLPQWLDYMEYLKENYSYLFSLSMRTNPFDPAATPVVRD